MLLCSLSFLKQRQPWSFSFHVPLWMIKDTFPWKKKQLKPPQTICYQLYFNYIFHAVVEEIEFPCAHYTAKALRDYLNGTKQQNIQTQFTDCTPHRSCGKELHLWTFPWKGFLFWPGLVCARGWELNPFAFVLTQTCECVGAEEIKNQTEHRKIERIKRNNAWRLFVCGK